MPEMNVALMFPARTDTNGTTWYRGVDHDGKLTDGWTADLAQAHPHYRRPDAPAPLRADQT